LLGGNANLRDGAFIGIFPEEMSVFITQNIDITDRPDF
jgi:hypothetical protein